MGIKVYRIRCGIYIRLVCTSMYKLKSYFTYIISFNPYNYYIKVPFPFYRLKLLCNKISVTVKDYILSSSQYKVLVSITVTVSSLMQRMQRTTSKSHDWGPLIKHWAQFLFLFCGKCLIFSDVAELNCVQRKANADEEVLRLYRECSFIFQLK